MFSPCSRLTDLYQARFVRKARRVVGAKPPSLMTVFAASVALLATGVPVLRPSAYCNCQHSQSTLRRPSTTLTVINALW